MSKYEEIEKVLGYTFKDRSLLIKAFTHKSYDKIKNNGCGYERLEFIGDAILDFFATEYLYNKFPDYDQGVLTDLRKKIVSKEPLKDIVEKNNLDKYVTSIQPLSDKKKSDIVESSIAAVYLDSNFEEAKKVFFNLFQETIDKLNADLSNIRDISSIKDSKSLVFEKYGIENVEFKTLSEEGRDNEKIFERGLFIKGKLVTKAKGSEQIEVDKICAEKYLNKKEQ